MTVFFLVLLKLPRFSRRGCRRRRRRPLPFPLCRRHPLFCQRDIHRPRRAKLVGCPLDDHHEVVLLRAPLDVEVVIDELIKVLQEPVRPVGGNEHGPLPLSVEEVAVREALVRPQWDRRRELLALVHAIGSIELEPAARHMLHVRHSFVEVLRRGLGVEVQVDSFDLHGPLCRDGLVLRVYAERRGCRVIWLASPAALDSRSGLEEGAQDGELEEKKNAML